MAEKGVPADVQKLFDDSVRILREDAGLAQNRALMARLDSIESNTRKVPQTPEEKAAAYDALMAQGSGGNAKPTPTNEPAKTQGNPTPPTQKPPAQSQEERPDWWWGGNG